MPIFQQSHYLIQSCEDGEGKENYIEKVYFDDAADCGKEKIEELKKHIVEGWGLQDCKVEECGSSNNTSAFYNGYERDEHQNPTKIEHYYTETNEFTIYIGDLFDFASTDLSLEIYIYTYKNTYDSHGETLLIESYNESGEKFQTSSFVNTYSDGSKTSYTEIDATNPTTGASAATTTTTTGGSTSTTTPTTATSSSASTEVCDGVDNDLDGLVDEDLTTYTHYGDVDGDYYVDPNNVITTCESSYPDGYYSTSAPVDCNDGDAVVKGTDFFYVDNDGDGWGDLASELTAVCPDTAGYVADGSDCNDADAEIYPDHSDFGPHGNGIDNDCDGMVDDEVIKAPPGSSALL